MVTYVHHASEKYTKNIFIWSKGKLNRPKSDLWQCNIINSGGDINVCIRWQGDQADPIMVSDGEVRGIWVVVNVCHMYLFHKPPKYEMGGHWHARIQTYRFDHIKCAIHYMSMCYIPCHLQEPQESQCIDIDDEEVDRPALPDAAESLGPDVFEIGDDEDDSQGVLPPNDNHEKPSLKNNLHEATLRPDNHEVVEDMWLVYRAALDACMEAGFSQDQSMHALKDTDGDLNQALTKLYDTQFKAEEKYREDLIRQALDIEMASCSDSQVDFSQWATEELKAMIDEAASRPTIDSMQTVPMEIYLDDPPRQAHPQGGFVLDEDFLADVAVSPGALGAETVSLGDSRPEEPPSDGQDQGHDEACETVADSVSVGSPSLCSSPEPCNKDPPLHEDDTKTPEQESTQEG